MKDSHKSLLLSVAAIVMTACLIDQKNYSYAYVSSMIAIFELLRYYDEKNKNE